MKLEITVVGDTTSLILPSEVLARLGVAEGDVLHVIELPDGGIKLTPRDPTLAEGIQHDE